MRPSPALALLVALATVVAGVPVTATGPPAADSAPGAATDAPADAPTTAAAVVGAANTTNYLSLTPEDVQRSQIQGVSIDVAGSAAVDDARIEAAFLDAAVRTAYQDAPNDTAERAALRRGTDRLDERVDRLVERERRARQRYNAGEWHTRTYLRELAVIDTTARRLVPTVEHLHSLNRAAGSPVEPARLARTKLRLLTLYGPVRAQVAAAMTGEDGADRRVYVASSGNGTVLATVVDDGVTTRYIREAYLGRDLTPDDPSRTGVTSIDAARERFLALYPWATSFDQYNIGLLTNAPYYLNAGVYALGVNHPQGTNRRFDLEAYLDADTGNVFREFQYVDATAVRARPAGTNESTGLRVAVEGTYVGGPMRVRVTDPATGDPVDATVFVRGTRVGTTGSDGVAAALVPAESFGVTVTADGETVTVDASLSAGFQEG